MAALVCSMQEVVNNELLLEAILEKLNLRDLLLCCRVSKQWQRMAMKEVARRNQIETIFYAYTTRSGSGHPKPKGKASHAGQEHIGENVDALRNYIKANVEKIRSLPQVAVFFHGGFCPRSRRIPIFFNDDTLFKYLPKECKMVTVDSTAGFIGLVKNPPQAVEIHAHYENLGGISYVLLPKGNMDEPCFSIFRSVDDIWNYHPKANSQQKQLKAIIVFSSSQTVKEIQKVSDYLETYNQRVAFGGLLVDRAGYRQSMEDDPSRFTYQAFLGLGFFGDQIKAASVVLQSQTESETEKDLLRFKESLDFNPSEKSTGQTLGFLFICTGRGAAVYGKSHVEATLVSRIFPGIKLTGLFGYGELGSNYWPKVEKQEMIGYEHTYTSVLVLIKFLKKTL